MNENETQKLLMLRKRTFANAHYDDYTIEAWHLSLAEIDFDVVRKAFQTLLESKTDSFAPTLGELLRTVRKVICPMLFLPFEQARDQNTKLYRRALRDAGQDHRNEYNPRADPNSLPMEADRKWDEKRLRECYAEAQDRNIAGLPLDACRRMQLRHDGQPVQVLTTGQKENRAKVAGLVQKVLEFDEPNESPSQSAT